MSIWLVSNGHVDRQINLIVINVWVAKLQIIHKITNFFFIFFTLHLQNYRFLVASQFNNNTSILQRFFLCHNL